MRSLRLILSILLTLTIWPAANCCLLAEIVPSIEENCCLCDGEVPAEGSCNQCMTLESGVNLAALVPITAPTPGLSEDETFERLIQRFINEAAMDIIGAPPPAETLPPPPLFAVTLPKALPVRGPSLAV
jgi:hypothetical protein